MQRSWICQIHPKIPAKLDKKFGMSHAIVQTDENTT